ncbi:MAG: hypothetical protein KME16_13405 [Scytolyngbya sp. HA4215-MV1]|nr:hypothetical protein [Scytolyngbya sp. HA4215-MV1]
MPVSSECPYCSSRLLQQIRQSKPYWFCHRCFEEVPYGIDRTTLGVQLRWLLPNTLSKEAIEQVEIQALPVKDHPLVPLETYYQETHSQERHYKLMSPPLVPLSKS